MRHSGSFSYVMRSMSQASNVRRTRDEDPQPQLNAMQTPEENEELKRAEDLLNQWKTEQLGSSTWGKIALGLNALRKSNLDISNMWRGKLPKTRAECEAQLEYLAANWWRVLPEILLNAAFLRTYQGLLQPHHLLLSRYQPALDRLRACNDAVVQLCLEYNKASEHKGDDPDADSEPVENKQVIWRTRSDALKAIACFDDKLHPLWADWAQDKLWMVMLLHNGCLWYSKGLIGPWLQQLRDDVQDALSEEEKSPRSDMLHEMVQWGACVLAGEPGIDAVWAWVDALGCCEGGVSELAVVVAQLVRDRVLLGDPRDGPDAVAWDDTVSGWFGRPMFWQLVAGWLDALSRATGDAAPLLPPQVIEVVSPVLREHGERLGVWLRAHPALVKWAWVPCVSELLGAESQAEMMEAKGVPPDAHGTLEEAEVVTGILSWCRGAMGDPRLLDAQSMSVVQRMQHGLFAEAKAEDPDREFSQWDEQVYSWLTESAFWRLVSSVVAAFSEPLGEEVPWLSSEAAATASLVLSEHGERLGVWLQAHPELVKSVWGLVASQGLEGLQVEMDAKEAERLDVPRGLSEAELVTGVLSWCRGVMADPGLRAEQSMSVAQRVQRVLFVEAKGEGLEAEPALDVVQWDERIASWMTKPAFWSVVSGVVAALSQPVGDAAPCLSPEAAAMALPVLREHGERLGVWLQAHPELVKSVWELVAPQGLEGPQVEMEAQGAEHPNAPHRLSEAEVVTDILSWCQDVMAAPGLPDDSPMSVVQCVQHGLFAEAKPEDPEAEPALDACQWNEQASSWLTEPAFWSVASGVVDALSRLVGDAAPYLPPQVIEVVSPVLREHGERLGVWLQAHPELVKSVWGLVASQGLEGLRERMEAEEVHPNAPHRLSEAEVVAGALLWCQGMLADPEFLAEQPMSVVQHGLFVEAKGEELEDEPAQGSCQWNEQVSSWLIEPAFWRLASGVVAAFSEPLGEEVPWLSSEAAATASPVLRDHGERLGMWLHAHPELVKSVWDLVASQGLEGLRERMEAEEVHPNAPHRLSEAEVVTGALLWCQGMLADPEFLAEQPMSVVQRVLFVEAKGEEPEDEPAQGSCQWNEQVSSWLTESAFWRLASGVVAALSQPVGDAEPCLSPEAAAMASPVLREHGERLGVWLQAHPELVKSVWDLVAPQALERPRVEMEAKGPQPEARGILEEAEVVADILSWCQGMMADSGLPDALPMSVTQRVQHGLFVEAKDEEPEDDPAQGSCQWNEQASSWLTAPAFWRLASGVVAALSESVGDAEPCLSPEAVARASPALQEHGERLGMWLQAHPELVKSVWSLVALQGLERPREGMEAKEVHPNAPHRLSEAEVVTGILSWCRSVASDLGLPEVQSMSVAQRVQYGLFVEAKVEGPAGETFQWNEQVSSWLTQPAFWLLASNGLDALLEYVGEVAPWRLPEWAAMASPVLREHGERVGGWLQAHPALMRAVWLSGVIPFTQDRPESPWEDHEDDDAGDGDYEEKAAVADDHEHIDWLGKLAVLFENEDVQQAVLQELECPEGMLPLLFSALKTRWMDAVTQRPVPSSLEPEAWLAWWIGPNASREESEATMRQLIQGALHVMQSLQRLDPPLFQLLWEAHMATGLQWLDHQYPELYEGLFEGAVDDEPRLELADDEAFEAGLAYDAHVPMLLVGVQACLRPESCGALEEMFHRGWKLYDRQQEGAATHAAREAVRAERLLTGAACMDFMHQALRHNQAFQNWAQHDWRAHVTARREGVQRAVCSSVRRVTHLERIPDHATWGFDIVIDTLDKPMLSAYMARMLEHASTKSWWGVTACTVQAMWVSSAMRWLVASVVWAAIRQWLAGIAQAVSNGVSGIRRRLGGLRA